MTKTKPFAALFVGILMVVSTLGETGVRAVPEAAPTSPLALGQHPRIGVTAQNLGAIKTQLAGANKQRFQTWISYLDNNVPSNPDPYDAMNYAFVWLTYPVTGINYGKSQSQYGDLARGFVNQITASNQKVINIHWYGLAVAYDWINPLLGPSERAAVVTLLKTIDSFTSHVNDTQNPQNAAYVAARAQKFLSGLAFSGDGIDDAWAATAVGRYAEQFRGPTGTTTFESAVNGPESGFSEGMSYGVNYIMRHLLVAEEAWRTANGISIASHYAGADAYLLRYFPSYVAASLLPYPLTPGRSDGVFWKTHAMGAALGPKSNPWNREGQFALLALTRLYQSIDPDQASLAAYLVDDVFQSTGSPISMQQNWLFGFFLSEVPINAVPKSPSALGMPLSRAHTNGWFVFRTGWDNPADSYVTFHANKWWWNSADYAVNSPGAFTIDRKGPQVIKQGWQVHDFGSIGPGAANMLVFPDRRLSGPTGTYDDYGGHRRFPQGLLSSVNQLVDDTWQDVRDEVRHQPADASAGRDVDYVFADVTRAYNSTRITDGRNPAKVSEVIRQFVYFRPARRGVDSDRVVVFDRTTTTDTNFEKNWLFHTAGEPQVDGPQLAGQPVRAGSGEGKWTYPSATRITATNTAYGSNGTVWLTPLLPANRVVVKIGGPDAMGNSWTSGSHEFETPYGTPGRLQGTPSPNQVPYVGEYRVEVIPGTASLADVFLNVVEVGDAGSSPSAVALLPSSGGVVAARVGDRVATFNSVSASVTQGSFTMDAGGTYGLHIADLIPCGIYEITVGGATPVMKTATSAGTLYFQQTLTAGTVVTIRLQ